MINKLTGLPDYELKNFYRLLTDKLLEVFGLDYYEDDEEELQMGFHYYKNGDRADYHKTVDKILSEIAPRGIELNWRDIKKLSYRRWHLCSECNKPFIAYDKFNTTKICYHSDYVRYKIGTNDSEGRFFKASNNRSVCFMEYKRRYAAKKII